MNRNNQILRLIQEKGPLTTTQVSAEFLMDRANTNKHLNTLVRLDYLKKSKVGRYAYYSTDGSVPSDASDVHKDSRIQQIFRRVETAGPKGGGTTVENVQILCADCNLKKSDLIE